MAVLSLDYDVVMFLQVILNPYSSDLVKKNVHVYSDVIA